MLVPWQQQVLTKACRLNIIQLFVDNSQADKIMDVPFVLAKFHDLLVWYYMDYQTEALPDDEGTYPRGASRYCQICVYVQVHS